MTAAAQFQLTRPFHEPHSGGYQTSDQVTTSVMGWKRTE